MLIKYLKTATHELSLAVVACEFNSFFNKQDICLFKNDILKLSQVVTEVGRSFDKRLTKQQFDTLYKVTVFKDLRQSIQPDTLQKIFSLISYVSSVLNRNLRQAIEDNHPASMRLNNLFYIPLTMLPYSYAHLIFRINEEFLTAGIADWDIRLVGSQVLYNLLLTWTTQESTDLQQIKRLASISDFDLKFVPDKYPEGRVVLCQKFENIISRIACAPLAPPYDGKDYEPYYYGLKIFNTDLVLTNEPFYHFSNSHLHLSLRSQCVVADSVSGLKELWQNKITIHQLEEHYSSNNINKLAYTVKCVSKLKQLGYELSTDNQKRIFTDIISDPGVRSACLRKYPEISLPPLLTQMETSAFSSQFPSRGGSPILQEESVELPLLSEIVGLIDREEESRENILKLACDEFYQLLQSKILTIEQNGRDEIINSESKQYRQQLRLFELFNAQKVLGKSLYDEKDQLLRSSKPSVLSSSLLSKRNTLQEEMFTEFEGLWRITWMLAHVCRDHHNILYQMSTLALISYELEKVLSDQRLQREKLTAQYIAELDEVPSLFKECLHEEFLYEEDILREDIIHEEKDARSEIPVGIKFLPSHLQVHYQGVIKTLISVNEVSQILSASIADIESAPKSLDGIAKRVEVIQVFARFKKFLPDLHRSHTHDIDTPLMAAVKNGKVENIKLLIEFGALVNHLSADENTLVYEAALNNHGDVLDVLLLAEAVCDHPRLSTGTTPLQAAVELRYADIVIKLLKAGASPVRKNLKNISAFNIPIYYFDLVSDTNEQLILVWLLAALKAHGFKHIFQEYDVRPFLLRSKAKQSVVTFLQKKDSGLDKQVAELAKTIDVPERSLVDELISFDFVERIGVKPQIIPVATTEKDKVIEGMQKRLAQRQQLKK